MIETHILQIKNVLLLDVGCLLFQNPLFLSDSKYKPSEGVEAVDVEEMVLILEGLDDLGH